MRIRYIFPNKVNTLFKYHKYTIKNMWPPFYNFRLKLNFQLSFVFCFLKLRLYSIFRFVTYPSRKKKPVTAYCTTDRIKGKLIAFSLEWKLSWGNFPGNFFIRVTENETRIQIFRIVRSIINKVAPTCCYNCVTVYYGSYKHLVSIQIFSCYVIIY